MTDPSSSDPSSSDPSFSDSARYDPSPPDASHVDPWPPPTDDPTLEQITRWYALLCDLGLDDAMDAARHTAEPPSGTPLSASGDPLDGSTSEPGDRTVSIDMAHLWRCIARENRLLELGSIVFDVTEEEAKGITHDQLREGLIPFALACSGVLGTLTRFAVASG